MLERLTSSEFVKNLAITYDALTELAYLSTQLQRREMTMYEADTIIRRQIRVLDSMVDEPGSHLQEALEAIEQGEFYGIELHKGSKHNVEINSGQFYRSLSDNLKERMLTTTASHGSLASSVKDRNKKDYEKLLQALKVLDPTTWPATSVEDGLSIRYGEDEIRRLCKKLHIPEEKSVHSFREFKETPTLLPEGLKELKAAVSTLVTSTAECERCFSVMNDIFTPTRSRFTVEHVSSLVFLKCVGPPLKDFSPQTYIKSWISSGRRTADFVGCMARRDTAGASASKSSSYQSIWNML